MSVVITDRHWQLRAACRGPVAEVFFPPVLGEGRSQRRTREQQAKAICATCCVRAACLAQAVESDEPHGVWGGLTEGERQRFHAAN